MKYNFPDANSLNSSEVDEELANIDYIEWLFKHAEEMAAFDHRLKRQLMEQISWYRGRLERRLHRLMNTKPICPHCNTDLTIKVSV